MRRLAPLLLVVLALTACGSEEPVESAISEGYAADWPRISRQTLAAWDSFPVSADPRPLVLLGEPVLPAKGFAENSAKSALLEGRVDPAGNVPPEAAEAFAKLTKPGAGEPEIKVISAEKGVATFATDRGPRELSAWHFRLTGVEGSIAVLAVKPDYQNAATIYSAVVSADGLTLTARLPGPPVPCVGEPRITYHTELMESPTAVAVGLKKRTGKTLPGDVASCRHMPNSTTEYTITLSKPLGGRVLIGANGQALPVTSAQP